MKWLAEPKDDAAANGNGQLAPRVVPVDGCTRLTKRGAAALQLMLEAHEYSQELSRSIWDFAVEIEALRQAGLTNSDFRWMICKGFAEQARELAVLAEEARAFRRCNSLTFHRKSCFTLTDSGVHFVRTTLAQLPAAPEPFRPRLVTESNGNGTLTVPKWDRDRQELRFRNLLVKQYKVPAGNQEMILSAFEEESWPPRIDDPLPPHPHLDPKRRLHDTINSLNRNQKNSVMRFLGDGSGEGVRWEPVREESSAENGNGSHH